MTGRLLWWYQAACECVWWRDGGPCWEPCPLHLHMAQARWC